MLFSEPKIPQSGEAIAGSASGRRFQCSSASRKFLNRRKKTDVFSMRPCFSALQRAENSSMFCVVARQVHFALFQCSSASRKFLNCSSLMRASKASAVSVLFSEPKIPQCMSRRLRRRRSGRFSALQRAENSSMLPTDRDRVRFYMFQCSSASRKFLNHTVAATNYQQSDVSVLFSEPKIPQS